MYNTCWRFIYIPNNLLRIWSTCTNILCCFQSGFGLSIYNYVLLVVCGTCSWCHLDAQKILYTCVAAFYQQSHAFYGLLLFTARSASYDVNKMQYHRVTRRMQCLPGNPHQQRSPLEAIVQTKQVTKCYSIPYLHNSFSFQWRYPVIKSLWRSGANCLMTKGVQLCIDCFSIFADTCLMLCLHC